MPDRAALVQACKALITALETSRVIPASDNTPGAEEPLDALIAPQDNPDTMSQLSVTGMTGEEFRRRRLEAGLTQAEVSRLLGVTSRTITRWEHGISRIDVWKSAEIKRSLFPGMKRHLEVVDRLLDNASRSIDRMSTGDGHAVPEGKT